MSRGAVGFWIENGELTHPVQEITIAGNLLKSSRASPMVGNDLNFSPQRGRADLAYLEAPLGGA